MRIDPTTVKVLAAGVAGVASAPLIAKYYADAPRHDRQHGTQREDILNLAIFSGISLGIVTAALSFSMPVQSNFGVAARAISTAVGGAAVGAIGIGMNHAWNG